MKDVIIIGASGHGKVVADIVLKSGDRVRGFLDDDASLPETFIGRPILGTTNQYPEYKDGAEFIIAIGDASIREMIAERLTGVQWYTAIHPAAVIAGDVQAIGEGTVIAANAVVNPNASIGSHCIINSGAIVEHDCIIEDFAHVSVGTKLGGTVHVGRSTWVGIGACVSNNIDICRNCMIGAGAVVIRDIDKSGTYVGCPAKFGGDTGQIEN